MTSKLEIRLSFQITTENTGHPSIRASAEGFTLFKYVIIIIINKNRRKQEKSQYRTYNRVPKIMWPNTVSIPFCFLLVA